MQERCYMCLYNYVLIALVILGHLILVLTIWMVHVTFIGTALTTSKNTSKLVRNLHSSTFQSYKYVQYYQLMMSQKEGPRKHPGHGGPGRPGCLLEK
jgi:hypothetical protein